MYTQNKKGVLYDVRFINSSDFKFTSVNMDEGTEEPVAKPEKKKKDKTKKDGKRPPRDGKMPPPPNK